MKTTLITGANRGIGFEIARQLGKRDFTILAGARSEQKGKDAVKQLQAENIHAHFVQLDVNDAASIQGAYDEIKNQWSKLDVLINNAAILLDEEVPFLETDAEMLKKTLHVNTVGPYLVIQTFLPLLQSGSRVINVSSGAGQICGGMGTYAPVYSISKTALNAVTCQFAHALKNKGIAVNAVSPGWVRTEMGGSDAPRSVEEGAETPVWLATEAPLSYTGKFFKDKEERPW